MARPRQARVTKRSSARLGGRLSAEGAQTAEAPVREDAVDDKMDTTCDALELGGADGMHASGKEMTTGIKKEAVMVVDSQGHSQTPSQRYDKSKGRAVDVKEERHFAFMELPAELRLVIYRACLTRPYNILLSKTVETAPERSEEVYLDLAEHEPNPNDLNFYEDHPAAALALHRLHTRAPIHPRYPVPDGRSARPLSSPRAINRLTRPVVPRRRPSSTLRSSSDTSGMSVASSRNTNSNGRWLALSHTHAMPAGRQMSRPGKTSESSTQSRPKSDDLLIVNILRTNKAVYKEARAILYTENVFDLSIDTAVSSLAALHQRSRRLIRHVELEIPSYTEIQDKFSEVVRLSLRYCSGLRRLVIHTPFCLPGGDANPAPNSNIQIWAQGFDILRWLPQQCDVVLMGNKNAEIQEVVNKHLQLAKTLTPVSASSYSQ